MNANTVKAIAAASMLAAGVVVSGMDYLKIRRESKKTRENILTDSLEDARVIQAAADRVIERIHTGYYDGRRDALTDMMTDMKFEEIAIREQ